ncbi:MAG: ATP-binding protein [Terracidiphilus sp.]
MSESKCNSLTHAEPQSADSSSIPSGAEFVALASAPGPSSDASSSPIERISSEDKSDSSEAKYRRLFETAQDGMLILDAHTGAITNVNSFLAELLDYSRVELLGKTLWEIGLVKDAETSKAVFEEIKAKGNARYEDLPFRTKGGLFISVEAVSSLYRVDGETVIQCNVRDIRKRKDSEQLEQRLQQALKMEAVGQLAGGLAHDFNNLLGVILGYCEILEEQGSLPKQAHEMVVEIQNAGVSAKNLTQRLLEFSRRKAVQPVVMDLNETVHRMETMLGRLIGADVQLVSVLGDGLGRIKADASQVEQMLMNLAINARDAMPKGGLIVIKTENVEIDQASIEQYSSIEPGRYVLLTVSDTGIGMGKETLSRIFEPFFSTKSSGQGTGLGLSSVLGLVKQSGGAIVVYSEPGEGATFKIYFPRCDELRVPFQQGKANPLDGGTETILLVDDAAQLRGLTRRLLEDCGYNVLESGDPAGALRIAREHNGPLPLMITDVVMPGFSGAVLAERVAAIRPETKVLYTSGYNDGSIVRSHVRGQQSAFLEKPFTRGALLRKVRELLDATA